MKYVCQVWIRQSFREDGLPSSPVSAAAQVMDGPLHEGMYAGHCLAGDDVHEAEMTFAEAKAWARCHPQCEGFTFKSREREPTERVTVWFKSTLKVH